MSPRLRYPMPDFIREALESRGVMEAYSVRLSRALCGARPTSATITSAGSRAPSVSKRKRKG